MSPRLQRPPLALVALVALVVGAAASFAACEGPEEVARRADDGRLCADCHESPHALGGHADLTCGGCHPVDDALAEQLSWASSGFGELPEHAAITDCTTCHEDRPRSALSTEGHRAHEHIEGQCGACHGAVHGAAEGEAPAEEPTCATCHAGVEQHGVTAETRCETCHAFRASPVAPAAEGGSGRDAGVEGVGRAGVDRAGLAGVGHELAEVPITERMHGGVDCRRCHDPHQSEEAPIECQSCHRGYLAEQVQSSAHGTCTGCHDVHGDPEHPAMDCLRCHTYPEEGHGWDVDPEHAAATRAATEARITHNGDCASCHDPHTSVASEQRCTGCHEDQRAALDTMPPNSHEACTSCHQPHEPAPTAAVCGNCHTDIHARDANVPEHRDCLSCHEPHHPRPEARETCSRCHASAHDQTAASMPAHRDCTACHEQHGSPLRSTSPCTSCHQANARSLSSSPGVPAEHRCAGCHAPHTFGGADLARTRCLNCHRETVSAHASHRGACTDCHEVHEAPLGGNTTCSRCHTNVHPQEAAHLECTNCHVPHRAAVEALTRCQRCHATEVSTAARWPRASPHAGECTACHRPHDEHATPAERGGTRATLCRSCHTEQANRTHMGGHDGCIGCHQPHAPPPSGGATLTESWWNGCGRCHTEEAHRASTAEGTHARCQGCHETPGPPLPTCASCHQSGTLRLNHTQHLARPEVSCTSCHDTHGTTPPNPSRCFACHTQQREEGHFPDAASCQSCHPFR